MSKFLYDLPDRLIHEPERLAMTGIKCRTWRRLEEKGEVPRRILITDHRVCWLQSELLDWIRRRAELQDTPELRARRTPHGALRRLAEARRAREGRGHAGG
jgi:predicted DNA-binding transcriptional regulator AlpA